MRPGVEPPYVDTCDDQQHKLDAKEEVVVVPVGIGLEDQEAGQRQHGEAAPGSRQHPTGELRNRDLLERHAQEAEIHHHRGADE